VRRSMKSSLRKLFAMPRLLGVAIVGSLALGLFMPVIVCLPSAAFGAFGETLTHHDLWSYGYAPVLLVVSLALLVAGVGLFRGWGWARWIIVSLYTSQVPLILVHGRRYPDKINGLLVD